MICLGYSSILGKHTAKNSSFTKKKKSMGHDEAVVTQNSGKAPSPAKDQPAIYPYLDWSTMQSYYGPGIWPPTFFHAGITSGPVPPSYMWGPQNLPPAAFGKPYAAIYPHAGGFLHPFMPLMVNPLNAEPAKSVNSKENSLNEKLKEFDGIAVSTGSGNSEKTSGDYSLEGSSDGNNQKASGTPKKRSLDDMTTSDAETCGASAPNNIPGGPGRLATLANVRILDTAIKPCASRELARHHQLNGQLRTIRKQRAKGGSNQIRSLPGVQGSGSRPRLRNWLQKYSY